MSGKSTNAQVSVRVNEVFIMLIAGSRRAEIIQYAENNEWELCDSSIDDYIRKAKDSVTEYLDIKKDEWTSKQIARYEHLFTKAYDIQDYKTCLAVAKEHSLLLGLNAPTKIANTTPDGEGPMVINVKLIKEEDPND